MARSGRFRQVPAHSGEFLAPDAAPRWHIPAHFAPPTWHIPAHPRRMREDFVSLLHLIFSCQRTIGPHGEGGAPTTPRSCAIVTTIAHDRADFPRKTHQKIPDSRNSFCALCRLDPLSMVVRGSPAASGNMSPGGRRATHAADQRGFSAMPISTAGARRRQRFDARVRRERPVHRGRRLRPIPSTAARARTRRIR